MGMKATAKINLKLYPEDIVDEVIGEFSSAYSSVSKQREGDYLVLVFETDEPMLDREFMNFLIARTRESMRILGW